MCVALELRDDLLVKIGGAARPPSLRRLGCWRSRFSRITDAEGEPMRDSDSRQVSKTRWAGVPNSPRVTPRDRHQEPAGVTIAVAPALPDVAVTRAGPALSAGYHFSTTMPRSVR